MNKEKIQKELDKAIVMQSEIATLHELFPNLSERINKCVKDLQAQLAEQPELQHGDIRIWPACVGVIDKSESVMHMLWGGGTKRTYYDSESMIRENSEPAGTLQDIFNEIKAIQDPLRAFKTDVHLYRIQFDGYPDAPILMAGNHHSIAEVKEHILQLQRLVYTAENE